MDLKLQLNPDHVMRAILEESVLKQRLEDIV
jgi:hypothetical protein